MRAVALRPAAFLLVGVLASGCGNAPGRLPGKIAFVSNQFPHTGKPGSNYGIFVYDKGKVRPFYQQGDKPQWDGTGQRLYCRLKGEEGGQIAILDYPSGELRETIQLNRYCGDFVFSKNGRYLLYFGWDKGEDGVNTPRPENLFIYDLQTKIEERVTSFTEHFRKVSVSSVDISGDGKMVVFTRDDRSDQIGAKMEFTIAHVYLLDLETKKIIDLGRGDHTRFLPSGDALVYTSGWFNSQWSC